MYETLSRPHEVSHVKLQTIGQVSQKLKTAEIRKEEKRITQIANAKLANANRKRKREGSKNDDDVQPANEGSAQPEKKTKTHGGTLTSPAGCTITSSNVMSLQSESTAVPPDAIGEAGLASPPTALTPTLISPAIAASLLRADGIAAEPPTPKQMADLPSMSAVSRAFPEVRGHTSYLTFGSLIPSYSPSRTSQTEDGRTDSVMDALENRTSSNFVMHLSILARS